MSLELSRLAPLCKRSTRIYDRFPSTSLSPLRTHATLTKTIAAVPLDNITTNIKDSSPCVVQKTDSRPLKNLPTLSIIRSLLLQSISQSPILLRLGISLVNREWLSTRWPLRWIIEKTFYAQYCAGANQDEIKATLKNLRSQGMAGIILNYAREIDLSSVDGSTSAQSSRVRDVDSWCSATLKTIEYTAPGDYVAVKYSGSGPNCLQLLKNLSPIQEDSYLYTAISRICETAKSKGVRILIDAEQAALQKGVDHWTLELMKQYNDSERAVVYNTYQMYLKAAPETLAQHWLCAQRDQFRLGVKIVRGAYLHSDPRRLIHDTKEDTDMAYDGAVRFLMTGDREPLQGFITDDAMQMIKQQKTSVPSDIILATHNRLSVEKAMDIHKTMVHQSTSSSISMGNISYAQLMGMADELSLSLVQMAKSSGEIDAGKVYKYAVWGTTQECLKYLMRRAEENRDAIGRNTESIQTAWKELIQRMRRTGA